MIFVKIVGGLLVEVTNKLTDMQRRDPNWQSRWDWKDFATVETLARYVTALTGITHLPCDAGSGTTPRYDLVEVPKVGDAVSKSFNGDSYPCGFIAKITPTWIITTDTGDKFRRFKQTAGWREQGRGFWMTGGHISERNPSF